MFKQIQNYKSDPIEALFDRLAKDTDPAKIDLGIGVFRDESGKVPIMQAVRRAEQRLSERGLPKSYLSPLGNTAYCADIEKLTLGAEHPILRDARIVSAQTPGAGSALRAGAEFVNSLSPESTLWASQPIWGHQLEFFDKAGMDIRSYRYYDQQNAVFDFEGMLEDLKGMCRNDILLVHGCCHNPTGQDLNHQQWLQLADVVKKTGAIPFIDIAYQGFGEGIEEDVAGVRLFAECVPQMLLTVSSSKSFGIYRERAGLLSIIVSADDGTDIQSVRLKLRDTVRQLYFMAPDHGAAIVHEILSTPELERLWRQELDEIRHHIIEMRHLLRKALESANPGFDASFIERQHGMFSCLPITENEQQLLEHKYHIYMLPNARMNVAAMNSKQLDTLVQAFAFIRASRESAA
ncbi:MAG: aromatic amino acid aminotransferase [SAR86 cluster bacterium]|uniref:Aromatic amino acid aminotransferase n=1 Tax=SAR86 cluster bacterium TaxID=2030880 RepID=A0A2A5CDH1_9GAMM|nr:MAG: aromatic amino acid aminotransferase [SAR86 cluster bacterium]